MKIGILMSESSYEEYKSYSIYDFLALRVAYNKCFEKFIHI